MPFSEHQDNLDTLYKDLTRNLQVNPDWNEFSVHTQRSFLRRMADGYNFHFRTREWSNEKGLPQLYKRGSKRGDYRIMCASPKCDLRSILGVT